MHRITRLGLIVFAVLAAGSVALAQQHGMDKNGMGQKGEVEFTTETHVGSALLKPGHYQFQHHLIDTQHYLIFEGAGVNNGWADYRDHHLGPELKAFENLEFGHSNYRVRMLDDRAAYVTSEYFLRAKMKERTIDAVGRETLILEKQPDGTWKIRHSHTGSRQRPAPKPPAN
jgi:hypothetical protein